MVKPLSRKISCWDGFETDNVIETHEQVGEFKDSLDSTLDEVLREFVAKRKVDINVALAA